MTASLYVRWMVFCAILVVVPATHASVDPLLFEADGQTPFDGQDLMVGDALTVIIHADSFDDLLWQGQIALIEQNIELGQLSAREPRAGGNWEGSILPAAGMNAFVSSWSSSSGVEKQGFQFDTDILPAPGDWFIFDYLPTAPGKVEISFYNDRLLDVENPSTVLTITQIPEPAGLSLLALAGLALRRRQKNVSTVSG